MKPFLRCVVVTLCALGLPLTASAVTCSNETISALVIGSTTADTAHLIYLGGGSCSGGTLCGSSDRAYIDFTEKSMVALAMAARINNFTINVAFDSSATSKGSATHGNNTCKIISMWVN